MKKEKIILILIFLLALLLRVWKLGVFPDAIDEDEMALGYYGYSLSKAGIDEYGNKFPIYFESVGDYKYGLYSYFAALPISIFGLSPLTTRIMAAIFGSLSVVVIYFLAREIFNNKVYGFGASLILAINPTHIHFSRVAYSNVMGAFFVLLALLFYMKWLKNGSVKNFFLTLVPFLLSIFSYQAYRVILPVLFVFLPLLYVGDIKKRWPKIAGFIVLAVAIVFVSFIPAKTRARSQSLEQLINKPEMTEEFSEDGVSGSNLFLTRLFHNKVVSFSKGYIKRYLSYFDPIFLFVETSGSSDRHSTPGVGFVYLLELPLLFISVYEISKKKKASEILVPVIMLLSAPLAASLLAEPRSTTRAMFMSCAMPLIFSYGVYFLSYQKYRKILVTIISGGYVLSLSYFLHQYYVHKVYHHPWYGDVGLREMVYSIKDNYQDRYSKIVVSGGHYVPFLFYLNIDPVEFSKNVVLTNEKIAKGYKVSEYGKFVFNMPYDCPSIGVKDTLYVCFGYKVPKGANVLEVFRYKDGLPAIFLVDFNKSGVASTLPDRMEWKEISNKDVITKGYWPEN